VFEGSVVGVDVGLVVGNVLGKGVIGAPDGRVDGSGVIVIEGLAVGSVLGEGVIGAIRMDGSGVTSIEGLADGFTLGTCVDGRYVIGCAVGDILGSSFAGGSLMPIPFRVRLWNLLVFLL